MIRNQWYVILESPEVKPGKLLGVRRMGRDLVRWRGPWNAFYSRAIENQLDVVHLPFVHYNTIGAGNKTIVNGPVAELDGNVLRVWVDNEKDHGQKPLRPNEIPVPQRQAQLTYVFPNLWQNSLGPNTRITAAFVCVDEEHTILYLRFYRSFGRLPGVRQLVDFLTGLADITIAHQDRRVVQTQRPFVSSLNGGEKLIEGDLPIVLYRRRRAQLQQEAEAVKT